MDRFSIRNNFYCPKNTMTSIDDLLRNRLWSLFSKYVIENKKDNDPFNQIRYATDDVEKMMSFLGLEYRTNPSLCTEHLNNISLLRDYICKSCEWYVVYDFVERFISLNPDVKDEINTILEEEHSPYRVCDGILIPITNSSELNSIKESLAIGEQYNSVIQSLERALIQFSDRTNPDYNSAIATAMVSLESLTNILTEGKYKTLGVAIKHINEFGFNLHDYLIDAIKNMYHWSCDEHGKRHGGADYVESSYSDAKLAILFVSLIINYLIGKKVE